MKVLIIGFGSIGKRHYENFKTFGVEVSVFSRRPLEGFISYASLEECLKSYAPTHVVISTETSDHGPNLEIVLKSTSARVLVEKPLFAFIPHTVPFNVDRVYVAYNLRFHPLINRLKKALENQKIVAWHSYVGQHLENWRPGRDYKKVYSSSREQGGGTLRDLSHEIDLFRFFVNDVKLEAARIGHFSNLESTSEDTASLLLSSSVCPHSNIHMNCIDRLTQRFVTVHSNEETYFVDLITGRWRSSQVDEIMNFDRNDSYIEMAREFLTGEGSRLCSFQEGLETNILIERAEKSL